MGDNNITVRFNVSSDSDTRRFWQFINDLRRMVRAADRPVVMQDAVRLRPQEDNPTRWMDLELSNADHTITLRLRVDNLYVVGFRNGEGRWFELRRNDGHGPMIQGATLLGFYEGYTGAGSLGLHEGLEVGRNAINGAINQLAVYDGTAADDSEVKRYLLTVIVSFVESMRLNYVAKLVEEQMAANARGSRLGSTLFGMIKNWSSLCEILLQVVNEVVQDPEAQRQRFRPYYNLGIHNAYQLALALGMVLISNAHRRRRRQRRSVDDNRDQAVAGITLVEVIEVIIRNIGGQDPGDLYGTISISDSFGSQQVFNRESSNVQSVRPGNKARLTGPARAVSGADGFAIDFNLIGLGASAGSLLAKAVFQPFGVVRAVGDLIHGDDQIGKGEVVWNPLDATSDEYDKLRSRNVTGANGAVELRYAVMTDAAVATVEVVVLDSPESAPDVYGSISSTTTLEDGTPVIITLLDDTEAGAIGVERETPIPLLRKAVAVPLRSVLKVGVDLHAKGASAGSLLAEAVFQPFGVVRAVGDLIHGDDHIGNGSVTFSPRLAGGEKKEVRGKDGRVEVRVAWSTWFE